MSRSLPLPLGFSTESTQAPPAASPRPGNPVAGLWAAIHLPTLPLEALGEDARTHLPLAVIEDDTSRARVVTANAGARNAGIRPGMFVVAACIRVPRLIVHTRDTLREAQTLQRLARCSLQFTSHVSPEPPAALLLEVGGSLTLFGGADRLRQRLQLECEAHGHQATIALAPTPRAALWLARAGVATLVMRSDLLPSALGALPLATMQLPDRTASGLDRIGVTTLREAFRLPRDGLARRFGLELIRDWDRALGRATEVRRSWQAGKYYRAEQELPLELHDTEQIKPIFERLANELVKSLRHHDAGIDALRLIFKHPHTVQTEAPLRLCIPTRDAGHLHALLATRLECLALPAPVTAVRLESGPFKPLETGTRALLEEQEQAAENPGTLIETLRARLGHRAVFSVAAVADHRPEQAWQRVAPGAKTPASRSPPRPLWLLSLPHLLYDRQGTPLHANHPLLRISGPERIEGGWWDTQDIARDYYVARSSHGTQWWVYRECGGERRWFLHGYFA